MQSDIAKFEMYRPLFKTKIQLHISMLSLLFFSTSLRRKYPVAIPQLKRVLNRNFRHALAEVEDDKFPEEFDEAYRVSSCD